MANLVEFIVKINDQMSIGMRRIASNADTQFNRMTSKVNRVGSSVDQLNNRIDSLQKSRNLSLDSSAIRRANTELGTLERKRDRLENLGRRSRGGFGLGSLIGIGSLAYLGKDIMQAGIERQMNQVSFETLLGKKSGDALNSGLLDFAKKSIYGNEVFNEGKIMAASGVKAGNIMPIMSMIGDIAMGKKDRMESLALAFSEASTRGSLNGMNERMFLQGGLFNPLQQLHLMTGKSMVDLQKDMAHGRIGITQLVQAMQYATGPMGRYFQMMQKLQNSDAGKWTAFTGTVRTVASSIGLQLLPALGGVAGFLTGIINDEPSLFGIAAGIGAMTGAWALYTLWTERAVIWQGILKVLAFWPLALIGATAGALTYLALKYDNWGKSMMQVWGVAKNVGIGIYDIFKFAVDDIGTLFDLLGLKIKATFQYIGNMVGNVGRAMQLAAHGDFKLAGQALTAPIKTDAGRQADILGAAYSKQHAAHLATIQNLFKGGQLNGLDFSMKGKGNGKGLADIIKSATGVGYTGAAGGGGAPDGVAATAAGISGGGVRNQIINIAKLGTDTITINTTNLRETNTQLTDYFTQLFNQVINSGNAAVSPQ